MREITRQSPYVTPSFRRSTYHHDCADATIPRRDEGFPTKVLVETPRRGVSTCVLPYAWAC